MGEFARPVTEHVRHQLRPVDHTYSRNDVRVAPGEAYTPPSANGTNAETGPVLELRWSSRRGPRPWTAPSPWCDVAGARARDGCPGGRAGPVLEHKLSLEGEAAMRARRGKKQPARSVGDSMPADPTVVDEMIGACRCRPERHLKVSDRHIGPVRARSGPAERWFQRPHCKGERLGPPSRETRVQPRPAIARRRTPSAPDAHSVRGLRRHRPVRSATTSSPAKGISAVAVPRPISESDGQPPKRPTSSKPGAKAVFKSQAARGEPDFARKVHALPSSRAPVPTRGCSKSETR